MNPALPPFPIPTKPTQVTLELAYMKSYEHMGQAMISCVTGCTCDNQLLDAHDDIRASLVSG